MANQGDQTTKAYLRAVEDHGEPDGTLAGWGTDSIGYDRTNFYVGSTDSRGHNHNLQVPFPTFVMGHMTSILQAGKIKAYRSLQDLVRDAVVHRLHDLAEMLDEDDPMRSALLTTVNREIMFSKIESSRRDLDSMREAVHSSRDHMAHAAKEQDWVQLRQMISFAEQMVDDLHDPWRSRMEATVQEYTAKLPREG